MGIVGLTWPEYGSLHYGSDYSMGPFAISRTLGTVIKADNHTSYRQYYGEKGYIKDGHRSLSRHHVMGPTTVFIQDACVGLTRIIDHSSYKLPFGSFQKSGGPNIDPKY